jgi:hypothetical protein
MAPTLFAVACKLDGIYVKESIPFRIHSIVAWSCSFYEEKLLDKETWTRCCFMIFWDWFRTVPKLCLKPFSVWLKDPSDKRRIPCDVKLKELFDIDCSKTLFRSFCEGLTVSCSWLIYRQQGPPTVTCICLLRGAIRTPFSNFQVAVVDFLLFVFWRWGCRIQQHFRILNSFWADWVEPSETSWHLS